MGASDSGSHRGGRVSTELVVARECLRAKVHTRLTGVAFGSDSYICMDPRSLVKASMRAVGKKTCQMLSFVGSRVRRRGLTRLSQPSPGMLNQI